MSESWHTYPIADSVLGSSTVPQDLAARHGTEGDGLTVPTATTSQSRNPGGGRASPGVALHFSRRRAVIGVICVVRIGSGTLCKSPAQSGVMADGSLQPR